AQLRDGRFHLQSAALFGVARTKDQGARSSGASGRLAACGLRSSAATAHGSCRLRLRRSGRGSAGMTMSEEIPTVVAPQVLLGNHLKALKLPTFAREYEKVAMESAQDRADYPRYLLRLCELERIDRERRNVERRIRLARFPQTKSFDTFDFAAQPSLNKALVL